MAVTEEKLVLTNEKLALEQTVERSQQRLREIIDQKNGLAIKFEAQTTLIDELHQMHNQVQKNLEHYREASLIQRCQDQQAHEQQRHQLEQAIQHARHETQQLQHQLAIAQQQFISEQKETTHLNDFVKQLKKNQGETDKILAETKNELLRNTHTSAHWQQQYQVLSLRAEQDEKAAKDSQAQLAAVMQKLAITEEALREVAAQNRLLIKDKWILEQEREAS